MDGRFKLVPTVRSTIDYDGGALLNTDTGFVYGLNRVGAQICQELQQSEQGLSTDALLVFLTEQFHVPRQHVEIDLHAFLTELASNGLIQQVETTDAHC